MLAIRKSLRCDESTLNILPCKINNIGPTKVTKRYWNPSVEADGTKSAYFRGRRLRGRAVKLPAKYHGLALKASDRTLIEPLATTAEEEDDEAELPEPTKIIEQVSTFEEITVWGHDQVPAADDVFVKGIEEWIAFAEAIHGKP